jgi:pimeloyl-ACP methyl ester carboxylesterase
VPSLVTPLFAAGQRASARDRNDPVIDRHQNVAGPDGDARRARDRGHGALVSAIGGEDEDVVAPGGGEVRAGVQSGGPKVRDRRPRRCGLTAEPPLYHLRSAGIDAVLAREPRPAILVGNSMGGWLALLTARRHPDHVSRIVLLNASAIKAEPTVSLAPRDRESARRAMDAVLGPDSPPTPDYVLDDLVRRAPTSPMARLSATSFNDHALDGRLGEIRTPVSMLWGRDDELLTPAYAEKVKAGLPQARIQYLDRCGHMPQRECADRLLPLLEAALAGR